MRSAAARPTLAQALAIAVLVAALLGMALPHPAAAHGGAQPFASVVGPYFVQAFARVVSRDSGKVLDYTLAITEAKNLHPMDNAKVTVSVTTPDGTAATFSATGSANLYEALVPVLREGLWQMAAHIASPLGDASFQHNLTVGSGGFPVEWVGLGLVVAILLGVYRWRRGAILGRQTTGEVR